jgi:hypothetical protein
MTRIRSARRKGLPNKHMTREHYVRCDNTGLRVLSGDVRKQWDGLLVWKEQFDERHPQEFVRGVVDNFAVREARPEEPMSVALDTVSTGTQTKTGSLIDLVALDANSPKYASFLKFTITTLDPFARFLFAEISDDSVAWTRIEDELTILTLRQAVSGEEMQIPIGRNTQFARLVLDFGSSQTITYSAAASLLGGNAI